MRSATRQKATALVFIFLLVSANPINANRAAKARKALDATVELGKELELLKKGMTDAMNDYEAMQSSRHPSTWQASELQTFNESGAALVSKCCCKAKRTPACKWDRRAVNPYCWGFGETECNEEQKQEAHCSELQSKFTEAEAEVNNQAKALNGVTSSSRRNIIYGKIALSMLKVTKIMKEAGTAAAGNSPCPFVEAKEATKVLQDAMEAMGQAAGEGGCIEKARGMMEKAKKENNLRDMMTAYMLGSYEKGASDCDEAKFDEIVSSLETADANYRPPTSEEIAREEAEDDTIANKFKAELDTVSTLEVHADGSLVEVKLTSGVAGHRMASHVHGIFSAMHERMQAASETGIGIFLAIICFIVGIIILIPVCGLIIWALSVIVGLVLCTLYSFFCNLGRLIGFWSSCSKWTSCIGGFATWMAKDNGHAGAELLADTILVCVYGVGIAIAAILER